MATIDDLYEAFSTVKLSDELPNLIQGTSYEIDAKVIEQLQQGLLSTGDKITPFYASPNYATKKFKLNSAPGFGIPDIKLTGALYAGIGVSATKDEFNIESTVDYAKNQSILQYGDNLLRLSEDNKQAYCDETLQPAIQDYITAKTGLLFE